MRALAGRVWDIHQIPDTAVRCPMSLCNPRKAVSPDAPRRAYSLILPGRNPKPKRRALPLAISSR
jgi:hypothetical protein